MAQAKAATNNSAESGAELVWEIGAQIPLRSSLEFACELVEWYRCAVQDKQDRFLDELNEYSGAENMCHEQMDCEMFQRYVDPERHAALMQQYTIDAAEETLMMTVEHRISNLINIRKYNKGSLALQEAIWMWESTNPLFVYHKNMPERRPGNDIMIGFLKYIATTEARCHFFRVSVSEEP